MQTNFEFDLGYKRQGYNLIAGADEAGRGPIAGPIVAAAVIMPLGEQIEGITDSKKLTEQTREVLYNAIISKAVCYEVCVLSAAHIDKVGIQNANITVLQRAILGLSVKPDIVLVDYLKLGDLGLKSESITKGDTKSYNIACASIIAKVTRDRIMQELDKIHPQYLLAKHKGYGTLKHRELVKQFGMLADLHRKTFKM
ncbi:MAG: ribonuclease HII [Firmicutes bacterium]|nr:ribonuclease HII [Bacillota bacterium]